MSSNLVLFTSESTGMFHLKFSAFRRKGKKETFTMIRAICAKKSVWFAVATTESYAENSVF